MAREPNSLRSLLVEFDQDLGVALDPLVKFIVGLKGIVDLNAMTDDLARLRSSVHKQIAYPENIPTFSAIFPSTNRGSGCSAEWGQDAPRQPGETPALRVQANLVCRVTF